MIDQVFINIRSGNGGDGAISGRHEKYVPHGGPDGGHGGDGGDVILHAVKDMSSLARYKRTEKFVAGNGGNGSGRKKSGSNGNDITISVPVGTEVWKVDGKEELLGDLDTEGDRIIVAQGGSGGRGNIAFATSVNQYPVLSEKGQNGVPRRLRLDLKVIADVGIIGAPNAGKSSLVSVISRARPKIAAYPFTTLEPVLGVVDHKGESFVVADIPGLIEGAHQGVGLGDDFLRHIERTKILVHVIDGSAEDPVRELDKVNLELSMYGKSLIDRPQIISVNKMDIDGASSRIDALKDEISESFQSVVAISAVTGYGIGMLLDEVLTSLDNVNRVETIDSSTENRSPVLIQSKPPIDRLSIDVSNGVFVVNMPSAARIAAMVDQNNWEAMTQFYAYLRKKGVVQALYDAGIKPGDTVKIENMEWDWE